MPGFKCKYPLHFPAQVREILHKVLLQNSAYDSIGDLLPDNTCLFKMKTFVQHFLCGPANEARTAIGLRPSIEYHMMDQFAAKKVHESKHYPPARQTVW